MLCFSRGLISLNTSVNYLIEPLPASTDAQQHAVFRAESLHLPTGSCPHHHGNTKHKESLNDLIRGITSPKRVSSDRTYSSCPIASQYLVSKWCLPVQEKRDLSQNMKYVELLIVADKAEVGACFLSAVC